MPARIPKVAEASLLAGSQDQRRDGSATRSPAPKGRNIPAQCKALGNSHPTNPSPDPERSGDRLPGFPSSPKGVTNGNLRAAQGWRIVNLEDVAESIQYGHTASSTQEAVGPRFLRITDIQDRRVDWETVPYCSIPKNQIAKYRLAKGDLLFARTGATVGKSFLITTEIPESIFASYLIRVRVAEAVNPQFIAYYFQSAQYWQQISDNSAGIGQPNVNGSKLAKITFPLPPLPEQRRIVARIEELFSRLDAGVAALRHAKAQLQRYRQSVLAAAVTGALPGLNAIHPDSWQPISGVIKTLDQGWSPKCESVPAESDDEWAVIKTTAIQAGYFLDQENKKLPSHLEPRGHLELRIGDLMLTRAGPRSRVGVACYVRKVRPKLMLCDKAYRVRLEPKKAIPCFIELVLNSPRFVDALDEMKSGISDSGLNLTQKRFAELLIPLPPLAEQHQTVAVVEARTTAIDHLEAELERQITRSNRLRQSTLGSAFEGNL